MLGGAWWVFASAVAEGRPVFAEERTTEVVEVRGEELTRLIGCAVANLEAESCDEQACRRVPLQVDERDAAGRWVLDAGSDGAMEEGLGILDPTDVLLFSVASLAGSAPPVPLGTAGVILRVDDPLDGATARVAVRCGSGLPEEVRSPPQVLRYDPIRDEVVLRHASLHFHAGMPHELRLDGGANVLDRTKVRARATFAFGWIAIERNEEDVQARLLGWRAGPLRVIRVQEQWVQVGWGLRTPRFRSVAFFYPYLVDLPLGMRLRFPATFFFHDIRIQVYADFSDLRGWQVYLPEGDRVVVDGRMDEADKGLNGREATWFALRGGEHMLVQHVSLSESLQSVRLRLLYHDGPGFHLPPEQVPGELPGIGIEMTDWNKVGRGFHALHGQTWIVPASMNPYRLIRARQYPLRVQVEESAE